MIWDKILSCSNLDDYKLVLEGGPWIIGGHYLLGSKFVVKTDKTAVSHFLTQPKLNPRQARWQEHLAEFDFNLEYKPGKTNRVADALSRKSDLAALKYLAHLSNSMMKTSLKDQIRENLAKDPQAEAIMNLVKEGKTREFWIEDDLLLTKKERVYLCPKDSKFSEDITAGMS